MPIVASHNPRRVAASGLFSHLRRIGQWPGYGVRTSQDDRKPQTISYVYFVTPRVSANRWAQMQSFADVDILVFDEVHDMDFEKYEQLLPTQTTRRLLLL